MLDGMGTTLTAFLFAGSRIGVLHIGDSRAYQLRDGQLSQITHDHTLVQTLVDEGRISEDEASTHPQRSLITRALDGRTGIEPDLSVREVRIGDRYLLCSDGLTGPVSRLETLQEALSIPDPQQACDRLVQLALRGGGPDNVTLIVADVVDGHGQRGSAPVVAGAAADAPQPPPEGVGNSAAARARAAEGRDVPPPAPAVVTPVTTVPVRGRGLRRTAVVAAVVLSLLAIGGGAGLAYVRSQYYVGVDGEQVAIYRGVSGSVAGMRLSSVEERTELVTERLDPIAASRVVRGIPVADRAEAEAIVERLAERFPECEPDAAAVPSPAPTGLPTALPSAPTAAPPLPSAVPTVTSVPSPPVASGVCP
jgi:protein phosphatase